MQNVSIATKNQSKKNQSREKNCKNKKITQLEKHACQKCIVRIASRNGRINQLQCLIPDLAIGWFFRFRFRLRQSRFHWIISVRNLHSLVMPRLDWEMFSPTSLMEKKTYKSRVAQGHYHLPGEIMLSWKRRELQWYLKSRSSTSICTNRSWRFSHITSPFWVCLRQTKLCQQWRPREFNGRLGVKHPVTMNWLTAKDLNMEMLMALVTYLCQVQ